MDVDVAVLGCGWAGILISNMLAREGLRVLCLEKEQRPGGLLKSEFVDGFTIDTGGSHIIFSKSREILEEMIYMLDNNVNALKRLSYVRLAGSLVPYPLENGLYVLPVEDRYEALVSFLEALISLKDSWVPRNLEEWIHGFFGKWIAKRYLIPYNEKIWKRPLNQLDVDWVYTPGRLPVPDWREIVKSALGVQTVGYSEQAVFYYPLRGGIFALFNAVYKEAIGRGATVLTNYPVKSIRKEEYHYIVNNKIKCKRIINTIPVPELVNSIEDEIPIERQKIESFDYNKVAVVSVALNRPAPNQHWIYVPDKEIIFHRYAWLSNYSPYNSPPGKSLVIAEISIPKGKNVPDDLVDRTLHDFERLDIIRHDEVIFTKMYINEYGYPIHNIGLSALREHFISEIERYGIVSVGRWGIWRYLNMDMVYREVKDKIRSITWGDCDRQTRSGI